MSNSTQSQDNVILKRAVYGLLSLSPCFIFLYINGVMLFTLRSKSVFRETSRYILLYNLLFVDTFQLAIVQFLFLLANFQFYLIRYVCVIIIMVAMTLTGASPVNLAVMSLERYVAVCFPLRHAQIVTINSTGVAIAAVWALCTINTLMRFLMLIVLEPLPLDQYMHDHCAEEHIFQLKISYDFDKALTGITFTIVGIIIIFSFCGVMVAARSASSDKASTIKASKTVVLHMIQLLLNLSTQFVSIIIPALKEKMDRVTHIQYVLFLFLVNLPRCLSPLIYGLRDQTIRPILMYHLRLGVRCTVMPSGTSDKT